MIHFQLEIAYSVSIINKLSLYFLLKKRDIVVLVNVTQCSTMTLSPSPKLYYDDLCAHDCCKHMKTRLKSATTHFDTPPNAFLFTFSFPLMSLNHYPSYQRSSPPIEHGKLRVCIIVVNQVKQEHSFLTWTELYRFKFTVAI